MKKQKTDKGFSLIELIIVIAIMAVLVVVCAPHVYQIYPQGRRCQRLGQSEAIL